VGTTCFLSYFKESSYYLCIIDDIVPKCDIHHPANISHKMPSTRSGKTYTLAHQAIREDDGRRVVYATISDTMTPEEYATIGPDTHMPGKTTPLVHAIMTKSIERATKYLAVNQGQAVDKTTTAGETALLWAITTARRTGDRRWITLAHSIIHHSKNHTEYSALGSGGVTATYWALYLIRKGHNNEFRGIVLHIINKAKKVSGKVDIHRMGLDISWEATAGMDMLFPACYTVLRI